LRIIVRSGDSKSPFISRQKRLLKKYREVREHE
jgi:hypothetical protein